MERKITENLDDEINRSKEASQDNHQGSSQEAVSIPLKPLPSPKIVGGNVVGEVDNAEYQRGVYQLKFSVIGRLTLQHGDLFPTTIESKGKLAEWIEDMRVIPTDNRMYHILLHNLGDQCKALTVGSLFLKPGIMRFNRWLPGFNI